jgi:uncharacterized membrane protein YeaQ/YmgE (transglycosylase-associated protein family)
MGICGWVVFGFFAGLIARAVLPGEQSMGLVKTTLLGIAGSFVGGSISALILGRNPMALHPSGFLGAILGSIVLLALGHWFFTKR